MTIEIHTDVVARASQATREIVERVSSRANASLAECQDSASANPGFLLSTALAARLTDWSDTLEKLITETMAVSEDLSLTASSVDYTEEENRVAAAALRGLL